MTLNRWVKQYSTIKTDDGEVFTTKQCKELQIRNARLEEEIFIVKKNDYHFHSTLKQRLEAVHKLRFQHDIKILCKILDANRRTDCKHYHAEPDNRTKENQHIARLILQVYADYIKRLSAYKITYVLQHNYGIHISVGRMYCLM